MFCRRHRYVMPCGYPAYPLVPNESMTEERPNRNPRHKPLSSGLAVSYFAAMACVATLIVVLVTGTSTIPDEQIPNDNPFPHLVNSGIGVFQFVEFVIGGTITVTLALVGLFLSSTAAGKGETTGNLTGILLCLASVVALGMFLVFFLLL